MIRSHDTVFMLSSFCSAVLDGRIPGLRPFSAETVHRTLSKTRFTLFETMKSDGAGSLGNVVRPQGSDAKHRPVSDLGQGG